MDTNKFKTNSNIASQLDWSVVGKAKLPKNGAFWWEFFYDRTYARNQNGDITPYFIFLIIAVLGFIFFHFFPFLYFGIIVLISTTLSIWVFPIGDANEYRYGGIFNLAIGCIGVYYQIDLGLHIFSLDLNKYYFYGFIISGALILYRRLWNAYIWGALDRFVLRYYKMHKISTEVPPELITDFESAYTKLSRAVGSLMVNRFNHADATDFLQDQTLDHFNHVIDLIEQEASK